MPDLADGRVISGEREITRETLLTKDGDVVHARVRELLGAAAR